MLEFGKPPKPVYKQALGKGMWIVMGKKWYTPAEHFKVYGKGLSLPEGSWRLADPVEALKDGQEKIIKMVEESAPKEKVINALERLNKFMDKVLKEHSKKNI